MQKLKGLNSFSLKNLIQKKYFESAPPLFLLPTALLQFLCVCRLSPAHHSLPSSAILHFIFLFFSFLSPPFKYVSVTIFLSQAPFTLLIVLFSQIFSFSAFLLKLLLLLLPSPPYFFFFALSLSSSSLTLSSKEREREKRHCVK